ncbi:MAG: TolC family outer membrane protein [Burkholderiales bacterium]|nr:MAG: TolC family outer membrane protein [Burkholderiales bacterium]
MHLLSDPSTRRRPARRPRLRSLVMMLALAGLGAGWLPAANAQSLLALYEAASAYDAAYQAARAQTESAQYRAEQSNALRRPSANLGASVNRNEVDSPSAIRRGNTLSQVAISGKQPLFNRANAATIDQAAKSLEAAQTDLESAEQDLIVRVAQAYFDVLAAQDTLGFARASKAAITEQLAAAKRNFEVGTATITDTREAQARFDLATATEIAAENDLRVKRIALDQLVGRTGVDPKPLATPVVLPPLNPSDADTWARQADTGHPLVRKSKLAHEIASLEIDKAKAGHLPTVDLVGSIASSHNASVTSTAAAGTTNSANLGVQLNVPLYAGYAIQNRVKETLLLEEKARNDVEAARRGVTQATRQAFFSVQSGQVQVKALEAAESSSLLALEATQLGYRVGVRVNLDVLNAQTQLFQTRRDLAQARYNVIVGELKLRQASGQLKLDDVRAADGLLAR